MPSLVGAAKELSGPDDLAHQPGSSPRDAAAYVNVQQKMGSRDMHDIERPFHHTTPSLVHAHRSSCPRLMLTPLHSL
jgi:hypothetical protein